MRSHSIDIAVPIYGISTEQAIETLDSIVKNTQTDFRLIVLNDNAGSELTDAVRTWRGDRKVKSFVFLRNNVRSYFARAVNQCVKLSDAEYFAVVHPQTVIADRDWLSKMAICFKDSQAFLCGTNPLSPADTSHPSQLNRRSEPVNRCLLMFRRPQNSAQLLDESNLHEPMLKTQAQILLREQRVYLCSSVRIRLRSFQSDQKPPRVAGIRPMEEPEVLIAG